MSTPMLLEAAPETALDRRVWVRYSCDDLHGRATELDTQVGWWAKIRDVSAAGAGLLAHRSFRPGSCLLLELPTQTKGGVLPLRARVVHATELVGNHWLIGCQ